MEKYAFGIDIGGTTIKAGVFSENGTILKSGEIPTDHSENGRHILGDIACWIKENSKELPHGSVCGVGLGAPGPVDSEGMIYKAVNLGWDVFDLVQTAQELTGFPCAATNDANAAALGEAWMGAGQGYQDILFVTLGTGVGGGIISGGKIISGNKGSAGEIGHIHVEDNETEACTCGNTGCLETYASATGAVRLMKRILASTDEPSILRGTEYTCRDIFDAAATDALALKAVEQYGYYLGKGLAIAATTLDPQAILLGGGVAKAGQRLINALKPSFYKYCFHASRGLEFTLASLGNDAGMYGAASLVFKNL